MTLDRRAFLGGLVATGALGSLGAASGGALPATFVLPGWIPPAVNQVGDTCNIASCSQAVSYHMGRKYGWTHQVTLSWGDYLRRADGRAPNTSRMLNVAADAASPGYVYVQHPNTRVKATTVALPAYDPPNDVMKARLFAGHPVVVKVIAARRESQWGAATEADVMHCVTLIGWNAWGFDFLNSWGPGWGKGGRGHMTWGYADTYVREAFAVTGVTAGPR